MRKFVWFYDLLDLTCQANRWYVSHCFVVRSFLMEFTLFCCKSHFVAIHAVCCKTCLAVIYALSVWRKITPKISSVEKKWQISCMLSAINQQIFSTFHISTLLTEMDYCIGHGIGWLKTPLICSCSDLITSWKKQVTFELFSYLGSIFPIWGQLAEVCCSKMISQGLRRRNCRCLLIVHNFTKTRQILSWFLHSWIKIWCCGPQATRNNAVSAPILN